MFFLQFIALYIPPIAMLIAFLVYFGKVLVAILSLIPPLINMAITLFLNPTKLLNDIITGIVIGIKLVFERIFGYLNPASFMNTPEKSKEEALNSKNNNCYSTSFMNILLLIICPPFAVFQSNGLVIHEIFFCTLLTIYGYYFPGLIYAILIVSSKFKKRGIRCKK